MNEQSSRSLYLDMVKACVLGLVYEDPPTMIFPGKRRAKNPGYFQRDLREMGEDWPSQAHSMIGVRRMDNLRDCAERVIADGIPGDFIETGVWRGGAAIFMRAILKAHDIADRSVWLADSFEGLPRPNVDRYPADRGLDLYRFKELAVSLEEVKANFARYGLLDDQVHFLRGWFRDTLPQAPIEGLSILRMDGDLYESTMDALTSLYPKLSVGGYAIVDDFHIPACARAVADYRARHGIAEAIRDIDGGGVYWRRERE